MSEPIIKLDLARLSRTLREVVRVTKKEEADIVNRASRDIVFRAMSFTKFADPGKIESDLRRDNIAYKIAARSLAKKAGAVSVDRFGNTRLTAGGRAKKNAAFSRAKAVAYAEKIIRIRKSHSRALRAGWIPAIKALGGSIRGEKPRPGGSGARGGATKATISTLSSVITNTMFTRDHTKRRTFAESNPIVVAALHRAVRFVTNDRQEYIKTKIEAAAQRAINRAR